MSGLPDPALFSHGPDWVMCVDQMLTDLLLPVGGLRGARVAVGHCFPFLVDTEFHILASLSSLVWPME